MENFKSSTTERFFAGTAFLVGIVGMVVIRQNNPVTSGFFPQCPLHAMTGLNCPGCGITRGIHSLLHGDILSALRFNALLPIYLFIGGYLFVSLFLIAFRGKGLTFKILPPIAMWSFLAIGLVFSVLRNIQIYPLNLLSPP